MKTKIILTTILIITTFFGAFSQIEKMREKMDDALIEIDEGLLTLRLHDAETGDPVGAAEVVITGIGTFKSDMLGKARFPLPPKDGTYAVHVECKDYITVDFPIEIVANTIFYNRFSLSKEMPIGQLRVVLEWDKKPTDLDVHFVKDGDYHISYRNLKVSDDGNAKLDRDDRDGYGPETITVKNIDERDSYNFYVHNYSNKDKTRSTYLANSKANVKVYGDNKLLETFQIPISSEGVYWEVFTITDGQINRVNVVRKELVP